MYSAIIPFSLACVALLGSPGPGIAALMAVGRTRGLMGGLGFLAAMQLGLAIAAGLSAMGLATALQALPFAHTALTVVSSVYLAWLAWQIASAPITGEIGGANYNSGPSITLGFVLGIANPKAFLAFASLFGSFFVLQPAFGVKDTLTKWLVCVLIMITVDFLWLAAGAVLGKIVLSPALERGMNIIMGGSIIVACLAAAL